MGKVKEEKEGKTINTINVSFDNVAWKALQKMKGEQSWRKFILERAAIDSSNEIHSKGINADALRGLCLEYDLKYHDYPESRYEGLSLLTFFLETIVKIYPNWDEDAWNKQIAELEKAKEKENDHRRSTSKKEST